MVISNRAYSVLMVYSFTDTGNFRYVNGKCDLLTLKLAND